MPPTGTMLLNVLQGPASFFFFYVVITWFKHGWGPPTEARSNEKGSQVCKHSGVISFGLILKERSAACSIVQSVMWQGECNNGTTDIGSHGIV